MKMGRRHGFSRRRRFERLGGGHWLTRSDWRKRLGGGQRLRLFLRTPACQDSGDPTGLYIYLKRLFQPWPRLQRYVDRVALGKQCNQLLSSLPKDKGTAPPFRDGDTGFFNLDAGNFEGSCLHRRSRAGPNPARIPYAPEGAKIEDSRIPRNAPAAILDRAFE